MFDRRGLLMSLLGWLRLFACGVILAAPLACAEVAVSHSRTVVAPAQLMCPMGAAGCPCRPGGGCNPGLSCSGGTCVGGGEQELMFEDDAVMADEIMAPESVQRTSLSVVSKSRDRGGRRRRASRKSAERSMPAPSAAASAGESAAPSASAEPPSPGHSASDPAEGLDHSRQVIYTATLQVSVFERDAAIAFAKDLPRRYGGWIESRYDYQITLRIRAEHLFEAIEELSALGVVLDKTLLAEDVTAEYVDLESRIRVLEQMVAQLEELLARATSVEQALQIRAALDRLRIELESARARMRQLADLVDFSTLTLTLHARGPGEALPASNDPFPWVDALGVEGTEYR